jgi:hypothetical protein
MERAGAGALRGNKRVCERVCMCVQGMMCRANNSTNSNTRCKQAVAPVPVTVSIKTRTRFTYLRGGRRERCCAMLFECCGMLGAERTRRRPASTCRCVCR